MKYLSKIICLTALISLTTLVFTGCNKADDAIPVSKGGESTTTSPSSSPTVPTSISPSPELAKRWKLYEEKDELTGKKTEFLGYESKLAMPNFPNAKLESKVYCDISKHPFSDKYTLVNIREVITAYDSEDFDVSEVIKKVSGVNGMIARSMNAENVEDSVIFSQDKYSNVFARDYFNFLKVDELVKGGRSREDNFIQEVLTPELIKTIPRKVEYKFKNGIAHVITYDDSILDHAKKCISNTIIPK
jgi:hypothetical protein